MDYYTWTHQCWLTIKKLLFSITERTFYDIKSMITDRDE